MAVEVHMEPLEFSRMEPENCSVCHMPTRYWYTSHIPMCQNCAIHYVPDKETNQLYKAFDGASACVKALEFYANKDNWIDDQTEAAGALIKVPGTSSAVSDCGEVARKALAKLREARQL
jgi:hypothetical protein